MKPIKIELYRHGNVLVGRTVDMPEEIRGRLRLKEKNYQVCSVFSPQIFWDALYINGKDKDCDNQWRTATYSSEAKAAKAEQAFRKLIDEWNEQHRDILDDVEREYLSAVLKPFKNRIISITKETTKHQNTCLSYIDIRISPMFDMRHETEAIRLPYFREGLMYVGMEQGKIYTAQELGLFEENKT